MSPEKPKNTSIRLLHAIALIGILAGAAGSLGLMLYTGRRNESVLLLGLFAGWVLSRSEEHTSELQSHSDLVCRLLLEKKKNYRRFAVPLSNSRKLRPRTELSNSSA